MTGLLKKSMLDGIRRARNLMARVNSISRFGLALAVVGAGCAWGQSVISAHAGMIHYVEGKVLLEGQAVDPKFGDFPEVKNNQVLETAEGRAEVLLTPGVFLRLAENSSFKMLSNKLSDTAFEVLSGSVMVEADEILKDNAITIRYKDSTIALVKQGLFRVDADTEKLRVYDGQADVTYGIKTIQAHKGKQVDLTETLLTSTFDTKDTDAFYRWVERRSEYIAAANVSSARAAGTAPMNASVPCQGQSSTSANPSSLATTGTPSSYCNPYGDPYGYGAYSPYGYYSPYGMWAWNPYYGMFTYLPGSGFGYSPFGWAIYSPATVGSLYVPGAYRSTATPTATRNVGPTSLSGSPRTNIGSSASTLRTNSASPAASSAGNASGLSRSSSGGGASSSGVGSGVSSGGAHSGGISGGGHR